MSCLGNFKSDLRRLVQVIPKDSGNARSSRRIQGALSCEDECRAFQSVVCYVQKGLGNYAQTVQEVVDAVCRFQSSQRRGKYPWHLFSFGWEDEKLHHLKHPQSARQVPDARNIAEEIVALCGSGAHSGHVTIKSLLPDIRPSMYSPHSILTPKDLIIFICCPSEITFSDQVSNPYKRIRSRSLWIFCEDEGIRYVRAYNGIGKIR